MNGGLEKVSFMIKRQVLGLRSYNYCASSACMESLL